MRASCLGRSAPRLGGNFGQACARGNGSGPSWFGAAARNLFVFCGKFGHGRCISSAKRPAHAHRVGTLMFGSRQHLPRPCQKCHTDHTDKPRHTVAGTLSASDAKTSIPRSGHSKRRPRPVPPRAHLADPAVEARYRSAEARRRYRGPVRRGTDPRIRAQRPGEIPRGGAMERRFRTSNQP